METGRLKIRFHPLTRILVALCIITVVAPLFQQGQFMDGLLYKTVAANCSRGETGFWNMKFTDISMNPFHEQPPFYFYLSGKYYSIFGNSFLSDRIFTLLLLLASIFLLHLIIKEVLKEKRILLFVSLCLLTVPVSSWTFVNQMIETLVLPLSLLSAYIFLKSLKNGSFSVLLLNALLFGGTLLLLALTKGLQSCFVGIMPLAYAVVFRNKRAVLFTLLASTVLFLSLYAVFTFNSAAAHWLEAYIQRRLVASMNGVGATTQHHLEIVWRTFTELIGPLVLTVLAVFVSRRQRSSNEFRDKSKWGNVLLITALAGSIPFAVTLEQRGFYLVPSFPFFVLALMAYARAQVLTLTEQIESQMTKALFRICAVMILTASLTYLAISPLLYKRHAELLNDVHLLGYFLKQNEAVSIEGDMWNEVSLQAYLYLNYHANTDPEEEQRYHIRNKELGPCPRKNYQLISVGMKEYDLYIRVH